MRISDWSSDVCASDLPTACVRSRHASDMPNVACVGGVAPTYTQCPSCGVAGMPRPPVAFLPWCAVAAYIRTHRPCPGRGPCPSSFVGEASSGGREGPCGLYPGGALSFKKKKQKSE